MADGIEAVLRGRSANSYTRIAPGFPYSFEASTLTFLGNNHLHFSRENKTAWQMIRMCESGMEYCYSIVLVVTIPADVPSVFAGW
jgi:hypothetical protein